MTVPVRLQPLLAEFDWACERLVNRMAGPHVDSGTGTPVPVPAMSDAEYLWERLSHLSEMLALRADYTAGTRSMTRDSYVTAGTAAEGIADFRHAVGAWRQTLLSGDDAALDTVGLSTYPYGSDPEERFIDLIWWVNQEVLHHGAEIALLRDLYRDQAPEIP